MTRGKTLALLAGGLILGLIAAVIVLLIRQPTPPSTLPFQQHYGLGNFTFHFRPVDPDKVGGGKNAFEKAWTDLFPNMAKDPVTRDLMKRLYGDLPVEFVVVTSKGGKDVKQADGILDDPAMNVPPAAGFNIVLRAKDLHLYKEKTEIGEIPFRVIAISQNTLIKDALMVNAAELSRAPMPGETLGIAMEDYMLRHAPDWVIGGWMVELNQKPPAEVVLRRADLDRRIKDFAERAKSFYGDLRKPK